MESAKIKTPICINNRESSATNETLVRKKTYISIQGTCIDIISALPSLETSISHILCRGTYPKISVWVFYRFPQKTDYRLQTTDCRLQTTDCGLQTADYIQTKRHTIKNTDCRDRQTKTK